MRKWCFVLVLLIFSSLLVGCGPTSPSPQALTAPSSQPLVTPPSQPVATPSPVTTPSKKEAIEEFLLECLSWRNYTEYGYIHVVGEVKNISNQKLEHIMAVVVFRDADGNLVKTDDALIDYDVLMPGQTSPFTVMTKDNPAIKKLGLSFKQMFGGQIKTKSN